MFFDINYWIIVIIVLYILVYIYKQIMLQILTELIYNAVMAEVMGKESIKIIEQLERESQDETIPMTSEIQKQIAKIDYLRTEMIKYKEGMEKAEKWFNRLNISFITEKMLKNSFTKE